MLEEEEKWGERIEQWLWLWQEMKRVSVGFVHDGIMMNTILGFIQSCTMLPFMYVFVLFGFAFRAINNSVFILFSIVFRIYVATDAESSQVLSYSQDLVIYCLQCPGHHVNICVLSSFMHGLPKQWGFHAEFVLTDMQTDISNEESWSFSFIPGG